MPLLPPLISALLERRGTSGLLYVDGYLEANATARGNTNHIDLQVFNDAVIYLSFLIILFFFFFSPIAPCSP